MIGLFGLPLDQKYHKSPENLRWSLICFNIQPRLNAQLLCPLLLFCTFSISKGARMDTINVNL